MKIRSNRRRSGGRSLRGFVGQFTSRDNLSLAGGVILAPIVTDFVRRSITLPTLGSAQISNAIYNLAIPGLGAMLTNKFSSGLAKGMVIGGLARTIASFIPAGGIGTTQRYLGEYLDPSRSRMGAYLAPQRMGNYAGNSSVPAAFNAWAK